MRLSALLLLLVTAFLISTIIEGSQRFKISGKTKQDKLRSDEIILKRKRDKINKNESRRNVFQSESNKSKINKKKNLKKNNITYADPDRETFKNKYKGNYNTNPIKKIHLNDLSSNKLDKVDFNLERRPQELFKQAFRHTNFKVKAAQCSWHPKEVHLTAGQSNTIQSPGYPMPYRKRRDCGWFYTAGDGTKELKLECETFWLRKPVRGKCKDYMLVSDGYQLTGHCGQDNPTGLSTLTGFLDVWFVSGKKKNLELPGFSCKVSAEGIPTTNSPPIGTPTPPLADKSCRCGRMNKPTKIIGGEESKLNEYPWMVAIVKQSTSEVFCGAAIINSRWIITAAHCTDYITFLKVAYQVLVGAHSTIDPADTEIRLNPIRIVQHPKYDYASVANDISLIEIPPLTFTSTAVAPICLPYIGSLYEATDAIATGWGTLAFGGNQPEILMEVTVTTITNSLCEKTYPGEILNTMICAGGQGGKDACQGDSGGPLIASAGNHHVLIGIVSWGRGCAMAGYPGVYTRVTEYMNWINDVVNNIDGEFTVCALE